MKTKNFLMAMIAVLMGVIVIPSCGKYGDYFTGGLSQDIQNMIPDTILKIVTDLGMPINKGKNPPTLEGTYLASPFVLKSSNRPGDVAGRTFSDYEVKFYNQDEIDLSLTVDYINGPEQGSGLGSFVSGSGNKFSVFAQVNSTLSGHPAKIVHIISGTLTSTGISNFYFTNVMIDNYGNPGGIWMEIGQCRIIYDTDGNSPKISSPKSGFSEASVSGSGASGK